MTREDLPQHEEKTGIDLAIELELLVHAYGGRHFHGCSHFPCSGMCEQAILAKEILRLRSCMMVDNKILIVYDEKTETHTIQCPIHNTKSEPIGKREFVFEEWKCPECMKG